MKVNRKAKKLIFYNLFVKKWQKHKIILFLCFYLDFTLKGTEEIECDFRKKIKTQSVIAQGISWQSFKTRSH